MNVETEGRQFADPMESRPSRRRMLGAGLAAVGGGIGVGQLLAPQLASAAPSGGLGVYDVTAYGASTSSADNSTAFNKAIQAASADGGGIVFVPAGRWNVAQTVKLTNFITFAGVGKASQIVGTNAAVDILSSAGASLPGAAGVHSLVLRDFVVWANVPMQSGTSGIYLDTPWTSDLYNVTVGNIDSSGATATTVPNNLYFGISINNFLSCVLSRVNMRAQRVGLTVTGNKYSADLWLLDGCGVRDTAIGFGLNGGGGIYVEEVDIFNCGHAMLVQAGPDGPVAQLFLGHCYLDTSATGGLVLYDNSCEFLQLRGSWIASGGPGNSGGIYTGVGIWTTAKQDQLRAMVTGCRILRNSGYGIFAPAGKWVISGCDIAGNATGSNGGIPDGVYARNLTRSVITGNSITDNGTSGGHGLNIDSCTSTIVDGNVLSVNARNSIKSVTLGTNA